MKLLITGVHGFVGSNLVQALKEEHEIYGLDIVSPRKDGVLQTFSWEDLSAGRLPAVDAVVHLAGKAHDTKNQSHAEVYFAVNTELTQKVYDYFLASPTARKFIFFSSVKAAADVVEGAFVDESVEPKPVGPYGESKIAAERYIQAHMGKQTYILRPCMIHGPGNKGNLNLLYSIVSKGMPWPLGAFDNRRTFTSIDNVSFIVSGLLEKDVASGVYNINDDDALSTNELVTIICDVLGRKRRIWHIPSGLMRGCAHLGGLLHLPLNPERLRKLTENYVSSNAKIKAALGVESLPVKARDGLILTIQSFQKRTTDAKPL